MIGDNDLVLQLLERGADINYKSGDEDQTALMHAIVSHQLETVRLLIEKGANVDTKALTFASREKDPAYLKALSNAKPQPRGLPATREQCHRHPVH